MFRSRALDRKVFSFPTRRLGAPSRRSTPNPHPGLSQAPQINGSFPMRTLQIARKEQSNNAPSCLPTKRKSRKNGSPILTFCETLLADRTWGCQATMTTAFTVVIGKIFLCTSTFASMPNIIEFVTKTEHRVETKSGFQRTG